MFQLIWGPPLEVGGCRCGCGSLHKFQIFKQNQNISISFIDFWPISGVPPMGVGVGGWSGSLSGCVCGGVPHARTHAHARAHVYDILGTPRDSLNGDRYLQLKLSCLACIRINS